MLDRRHLLLIPGLLNDSHVWQFQEEALLNSFPELQIDHISTHFQDTIESMADNLLRQAPEQFALAGLSMGGYVALSVMEKAPERVTQLALINTNARAATPDNISERQAKITAVKEGKFGSLMQLGAGQLFAAKHRHDQRLLAIEAEMAMAAGPDVFIGQQTACINRGDKLDILPSIQCETLIIAGQDDPIAPVEWSQEMAGAIPNAKLLILEDCGHMSALEQPEVVTLALHDWLQIAQ